MSTAPAFAALREMAARVDDAERLIKFRRTFNPAMAVYLLDHIDFLERVARCLANMNVFQGDNGEWKGLTKDNIAANCDYETEEEAVESWLYYARRLVVMESANGRTTASDI